MRGLPLLLVLVGCGRIGFGAGSPAGDADADAPTASPIELTVLEPAGAPAPGTPVASAYVILDDATIALTDANGQLAIPATAPRTLHVVYELATGPWEVTSFVDLAPGTAVTLGSRAYEATPSGGSLEIDLATVAGAAGYSAFVSRRCALPAQGATPPLEVMFDSACLGSPGHVYVEATDGSDAILAVGDLPVAFTPGAIYAPAWSAPSTGTLAVANVTNRGFTLQVLPAQLAGSDLTSFAPIFFMPPFAAPIVAPSAEATDAVALVYSLTGESSLLVAPLDASRTVDGSHLTAPGLAPHSDPSTRSVTCAAAPGANVIRIVVRIMSGATEIDWTAYLPPTSTGVQFPELPAELAAASPDGSASWGTVQATAIDALGGSTLDLMADVDRDVDSWRQERGYFPARGIALATAMETP